MKLLAYLRSLVVNVLHRSRVDDELEEELRTHVQLRADDVERSGLCRADAERQARVEFGGRERFKEECREVSGGSFIETLVFDARFSMRVLRKSPAFTTVAVLTLAVAIGANAVVFSVMDALVLRPLNVPDSGNLFMVERGKDKEGSQSYPDYLDLRDRNRSFDGLAAYSIDQAALDTGRNPARAWVLQASGNYFDALRIKPHLGRFFHQSDENGPNSAPYVVLSYAYWHSHFNHDPGVVGRAVRLNKHPFTILGVAPPEFHGTLLFLFPDVYVPIVNAGWVSAENDLSTRGRHWIFCVLGHLNPGVTPAQAIADLNSIGSSLEKTYPKDDGHMTFTLARPGLYGDFLGPAVRAFVTALTLLAGLILLAACANLGGLFAARAADRSREVALRLALGSARNRILRQLFTEALLISLMGGAVGLWGSVILLGRLSAWRPIPRFPVHLPVSPDPALYVVAAALAVISGILFGLAPVRQVLRTDAYQIIKSGSAGALGRRLSIRDVLLGAQIAICAVLVTSSIVAVRGMVRSLHSDLGFDPQNAMLVSTSLDTAGYTGDTVPVVQKRMIDRMAAIPGVTSVGLIDYPPLYGGWNSTGVFTDDTSDFRPANAALRPLIYCISPGYFQAAGTKLSAGRPFTWHDDKNSPAVAVVNRAFASRLFGSPRDAIGRHYKTSDGTRVEVVGLMEDGKYMSLTESPHPVAFRPILQSPKSETWLVVRSNRDPRQLAEAVETAVRTVDSEMPFYIGLWSKELDLALFGSRMATLSLGVLGVLGAMLSITGIFGMAAYSVSRRMRELGIRIAIGAQRRELLQAALGRAVKLLAFGSAAGLVLGIAASRVLSSIVYQATPRDPLVLAGVVVTMALVGLLATWIPAQRALSIDPLRLLREE